MYWKSQNISVEQSLTARQPWLGPVSRIATAVQAFAVRLPAATIMTRKFMKTSRLAFLSAVMASSLAAGAFSFTGSFNAGDQIQYFNFTTSGGTTIYTLHYGGGTNGAQQAILAGGFDPLLTIYDSTGAQVGISDDSVPGSGAGCISPASLGNNGCYDSHFSGPLGVGDYVAALTQFNNTPNGALADGFTYAASCSSQFCDKFDLDTALTGNWAVDFTATGAASLAPEPVTSALAASALALILILQRKRAALPGPRS